MRVVLTDRFVAGAKAGASGRAEYFDAAKNTRGLSLRVSKSGTKAWSFFFTSPKNGQRARVSLGTYPARPLGAARALAIEAAGHLEDGTDPRDVFATRDASAMTVAMLTETYLEQHVRPNLRTAKNVEQRFKKNITPIIGAVRLADLHRRDINALIDPIVRRKKPVEGNRNFELVRGLLNWATRRGDLDRNPMTGMTKPATEKTSRERFLDDGEIAQMWNVLPEALSQSKACVRIVKLLLVTGQRVGEVAGMRRDELDLDKKLWRLPAARVKNATAHTVPLSALAIALINDALKDAGEDAVFVFPSPENEDDEVAEEKAINPHAVGRTLLRAHEAKKDKPSRFGMVPFTAHDLRRTALTGLARLGVQPIVIGAVANHLSVTKSSVTFAHYVKHDYAKEKADALDLWAERVAAIVAGDAAVVVPMKRR